MGCSGVHDADGLRPAGPAWPGSSTPQQAAAALVEGMSRLPPPLPSIMSCPEGTTGGAGSTTCTGYTALVTRGKRPKTKVAVVHRTNATGLRRRMTPQRHGRC
jgi:hypothetical protein